VRVPFFDMAAELAPLRAALDTALARVLDGGVFIGGPEVEGFERELAAAAGRRRAVGVSSGTDALLALLMALEVGPGDEVVTTPLTFFATAGAAARLGARPVFVDVDDETLTLPAAGALAACGPRTRAIVTVHLYGHPADVPAAPCPVIEDAAHSLIDVPLAGRAAALSFFPTKNLGALGDAGAILTDDDALADRVLLLRTQGARPKYHHLALGGNFRLDALQAAALRVKLPHLAAWSAARRARADRYRALLADAAPELRVPPAHPQHGYHQFAIRAPRRDELRRFLAAEGIGTEVYYPEPLHLQPCFAGLGYRAGSMPVAERACAELLALPIHPAMAPGAEELVVDRIAAFYRPKSSP
jgi:dTDP-4-amino-4,6-dideoxygalactose transaminase